MRLHQEVVTSTVTGITTKTEDEPQTRRKGSKTLTVVVTKKGLRRRSVQKTVVQGLHEDRAGSDLKLPSEKRREESSHDLDPLEGLSKNQLAMRRVLRTKEEAP